MAVHPVSSSRSGRGPRARRTGRSSAPKHGMEAAPGAAGAHDHNEISDPRRTGRPPCLPSQETEESTGQGRIPAAVSTAPAQLASPSRLSAEIPGLVARPVAGSQNDTSGRRAELEAILFRRGLARSASLGSPRQKSTHTKDVTQAPPGTPTNAIGKMLEAAQLSQDPGALALQEDPPAAPGQAGGVESASLARSPLWWRAHRRTRSLETWRKQLSG